MNILIAESKKFSKLGIRKLVDAGHEVVKANYNYESLCQVVDKYDVIFIRLGIKIDENLLQQAKSLKFIVSPTTGLDHIDLEASRKRGVEVLSLRESDVLNKITATAEHAVLLMLMLRRNVLPAVKSVNRGEWTRERFVGRSLNKCVVGVVGLGRLGSMFAHMVKAMGASVIYFDPYIDNARYERVHDLLDLADKAEVVSVHVHLHGETEQMFDYNFFKHCKPDSFFINTARGGLVNESDLLNVLKEGGIAGAGLDVLADEVGQHRMSNELIDYAKKFDNLIITPHVGGATSDALSQVEYFITQKLVKVLNSNQKLHAVESRK